MLDCLADPVSPYSYTPQSCHGLKSSNTRIPRQRAKVQTLRMFLTRFTVILINFVGSHGRNYAKSWLFWWFQKSQITIFHQSNMCLIFSMRGRRVAKSQGDRKEHHPTWSKRILYIPLRRSLSHDDVSVQLVHQQNGALHLFHFVRPKFCKAWLVRSFHRKVTPRSFSRTESSGSVPPRCLPFHYSLSPALSHEALPMYL